MKHTILFLLLLNIVGDFLFAQEIKNFYNQPVDGTFEAYSSLSLIPCYETNMTNPPVGMWTPFDYQNGGFVCTNSPIENLNGGDCYGKLKMVVESYEILERRGFMARIHNLQIGHQYRLSFDQTNFGSSAADDVNNGFEIQIGYEKFFEPAIPFSENTWQNSSIIFCTFEPTMFLSIVATANNFPMNMTFNLGIDNISIVDMTTGQTSCYEACESCSSFILSRDEKYIISGWVKMTAANNMPLDIPSYDESYIKVSFSGPGLDVPAVDIFPSGEIIDGWQKMSGEFLVPNPTNDFSVNIELKNESTDYFAYFDDIRVHPVNSNLKSFVYDQQTQKLMAELDENNYATFYEYDNEGGLVRVKKETEKGIFTIQETRSSNRKVEEEEED